MFLEVSVVVLSPALANVGKVAVYCGKAHRPALSRDKAILHDSLSDLLYRLTSQAQVGYGISSGFYAVGFVR